MTRASFRSRDILPCALVLADFTLGCCSKLCDCHYCAHFLWNSSQLVIISFTVEACLDGFLASGYLGKCLRDESRASEARYVQSSPRQSPQTFWYQGYLSMHVRVCGVCVCDVHMCGSLRWVLDIFPWLLSIFYFHMCSCVCTMHVSILVWLRMHIFARTCGGVRLMSGIVSDLSSALFLEAGFFSIFLKIFLIDFIDLSIFSVPLPTSP